MSDRATFVICGLRAHMRLDKCSQETTDAALDCGGAYDCTVVSTLGQLNERPSFCLSVCPSVSLSACLRGFWSPD